ncbi:hypothetical protein [Paraburkholderia sp. BR14374]|uniref:hypothetical protein n=1 Tax=Paraburkholderia sp. BR14374 TaxID=3237007 RepID=UPI0034CF3391
MSSGRAAFTPLPFAASKQHFHFHVDGPPRHAKIGKNRRIAGLWRGVTKIAAPRALVCFASSELRSTRTSTPPGGPVKVTEKHLAISLKPLSHKAFRVATQRAF